MCVCVTPPWDEMAFILAPSTEVTFFMHAHPPLNQPGTRYQVPGISCWGEFVGVSLTFPEWVRVFQNQCSGKIFEGISRAHLDVVKLPSIMIFLSGDVISGGRELCVITLTQCMSADSMRDHIDSMRRFLDHVFYFVHGHTRLSALMPRRWGHYDLRYNLTKFDI